MTQQTDRDLKAELDSLDSYESAPTDFAWPQSAPENGAVKALGVENLIAAETQEVANQRKREEEQALVNNAREAVRIESAETEQPKDRGVFGDSWGVLAPEDRQAAAKSEYEFSKSLAERTGKAAEFFSQPPQSVMDAVLNYNPMGLVQGAITRGLDASQQKRFKSAENVMEGRAPLPELTPTRSFIENTVRGAANAFVVDTIQAIGMARGYGTKAAGGSYFEQADKLNVDPSDDPLYKIGLNVEEWVKKQFPGDAARQQQFAQQLAQGVGSTVGFAGVGWLGKLANYGELGTLALIGLTGAASSSANTFKEVTEALKKGDATEFDRTVNVLAALALGATEALPFAPTIGATMRGVGPRVASALEQTIEESLQEGLQGTGSNLVKQQTYDPNQALLEGVPEGMAIGALTGGAFGGALGARANVAADSPPVQEARVRTPNTATDATPVAPADTRAVAPMMEGPGQKGMPGATSEPATFSEPELEAARKAIQDAAQGLPVEMAPEGAPAAEQPQDATQQLEGLSRAQLSAVANDLGIPVRSGTSAAVIRSAIAKSIVEQARSDAKNVVASQSIPIQGMSGPVDYGQAAEAGKGGAARQSDRILAAISKATATPEQTDAVQSDAVTTAPTDEELDIPAVFAEIEDYLAENEIQVDDIADTAVREIAQAVYNGEDLGVAVDRALGLEDAAPEVDPDRQRRLDARAAATDSSPLDATQIGTDFRDRAKAKFESMPERDRDTSGETPEQARARRMENRAGATDSRTAEVLKASEINFQGIKDRIGNSLAEHTWDVDNGGKVRARVKTTMKGGGEIKTAYLHVAVQRPDGAVITYREKPEGGFKEIGFSPATQQKPRSINSDTRQRFAEVLASTTPRSKWAEASGVDPETLNTLIEEAVSDGRMEIRFGKPVRKAKARVAPPKAQAKAAPDTAPATGKKTAKRPATRTISRAEEVRLDRIKSDTARTYVQRLFEAQDNASVDAAITAMQRNKKVNKTVLKEIVRAYGGVRGAPATTRAAYTMIRNIAASRAPASKEQAQATAQAPAQQTAPAPEPQERRISIITPDGSMERTGTVEIVELDSLKAATGDMQPRDRSRKESDNQKRNIAANLDPQQLLPSRVSDTGAPLATSDGTVISGNGRVGALDIVYTDPALADKAAAYRQAIGAPAGMKKPVMVVRMSPRATPEELTRFADLSNRSRIASLSATERAMRDARAAGMDIMGLYTGGSFTSVENREFFRAFTQLIPPNELNAFSKNGVLTKEGDDRLSASVLAAAYGDPDMLSRMLEDADDDIRSITGAMRDAAGAFIRLKSAIRNGQASIKFDITPHVAEVAKRIADLRARNIKPRAFLDQQDAFNQIDPIVEALLVAFYNDNLSRQLRREKITEILARYADEAAKHQEGGLFEDTTTPREIVTTARTRALEGERLAATQQDFFSPSPSPAGRSDAGTSGTGSGQAPDGRGANTDRQAAGDLEDGSDGAFSLAGFDPNAKFAAEVMAEIAANDDLFQYPISKGLTLPDIFKDIAPDIAREGEVELEEADIAAGATSKVLYRNKDGNDLYVSESDEKEVWIDISDFQEGGGGSAVYAAVANYAFNTGRVFIGDPIGLSDVALRRRTDNMLSSALKFGTTEHLKPHPAQLDGDETLGIPPLDWTDGDDAGNIAALINVSLESLAHYVPKIRDATFDFATGTFRDSEGKQILAGDLREWAASPGTLRAASAGVTTLKRAILFNTLVRSESGERPGILESAMRFQSKLVGRSGLAGSFYSLGPGQSDRVGFKEAELPSDVGSNARVLGLTGRLRPHARALFAAGLDQDALNKAITALEKDRALAPKDRAAIAEAYAGGYVNPKVPSREIRKAFAERVHDVSLAELGGFDPSVSGSNLDWRPEARAALSEMAARLPEGVGFTVKNFIELATKTASIRNLGVAVEGGIFTPEQAARQLGMTNTKSARKIMAISLAYGPDVAMQTFTHEEIHVVRNLLTDKEWKVLSALATRKPKKSEALRLIDIVDGVKISPQHADFLRANAGNITYREIYGIDDRYGAAFNNALSEETLVEEVVAHAAADWADGHDFGTRIERVMMKIRDLIEAFGNLLRGQGFETVDSIFNSIWSGEVAKRAAEEGTQADPEVVMAIGDAETGRAMRRDLDALGYYSGALEAAKALRQAKGTPEQMLAMLKKEGAKEGEIALTGLPEFLAGKSSVTKEEIVRHIEGNRVTLNQSTYGALSEDDLMAAMQKASDELELAGVNITKINRFLGEVGMYGRTDNPTFEDEARRYLPEPVRARGMQLASELFNLEKETRWSQYSLDKDNPTYRETVLHLPGKETVGQIDFQSGHFTEPNIIGHMMTSMTYHDGKHVYTIDQIQSDWGQKLRDGGVRDEAKIADLTAKMKAALEENKNIEASAEAFVAVHKKYVAPAEQMRREYNPLHQVPFGVAGELEALVNYGPLEIQGRAKELWDAWKTSDAEESRTSSELWTAQQGAVGNPLVNTTDQWVNTTLRRAIRQAAEANAEYIAIPSGDTVLSYNPGDEFGMKSFYGGKDAKTGEKFEGIVPKNLRKLLAKLDRATPAPQMIDTLDSPSGKTGLGNGFTLFKITDQVKESVLEDGQAMFSLAGEYGSGKGGKIKAWHSTPAKFDKFDNRYTDEVGFHFGTKMQAHNRAYIMSGGNLWKYFRNWRDIPVEMDIKNPVRISEDPGSFMPTKLAQQLVKDKIAPYELIAQVQDAQMGPNGSPEAAKAIVRDFLLSQGYDAIEYPNTFEDAGGMSYMTLGTGNVRNVNTGEVVYSLAGDQNGTDVAQLNQAIDSLKNALGIQVTQNLFGVTIKAGKRKVRINPRSNILGQTSRTTGGVGVRRSRDIKAIAHEGGHSLELMLGSSLANLKAQHADALTTPFSPDLPMPKSLRPVGFSGLELDDVEQKALIEAVTTKAALMDMTKQVGTIKAAPRMIGRATYDEEAYRKVENAAGSARANLIRLIGKTRADALVDEIERKTPPDVPTFVQERFSPMGAPKRRMTTAPSGEALSEAFARWFEKYTMSREAAFEMAPGFFDAFEDLLEAEAPSVLEGMHTVQEQYKAWTKRATVEDLSSDVVSVAAKNTWSDIRDGKKGFSDKITGWTAEAYTGVIDDLSPVQQIVRRLLAVADRNGVKDDQGRPISLKVSENPYKIARMFRGSYATGYTWIKDGIPNFGEEKVVFPGLQKAMETIFGQDTYDQQTYQAFGQYLISKRAIAEYDRLAAKKGRLADIASIIEQGTNAWRMHATEQAKERDILDRRQAALDRTNVLVTDRTRAIGAARTAERKAQERIQEIRDDLAEAMRAIDDGSDVARATRDRRRRSLQLAERNAKAMRNDVVDLELELQGLTTDAAMLKAEIEQRTAKVDRRQATIDALESSIALMRREQDATSKRGASRPPTLEAKEWHEEFLAKVARDKRFAKFEEAAQVVYGFTQGLLTIRYQAGLIPEQLYQELSSRKGWYVPFMRDMSDAPAESVFTGGGVKSWSPFKKFDGSDRAIINPLEILSQESYAAAQHIAMNEAVGALAALAQKAGPGSANIAELMQRTEDLENNPETFTRIRDIAISMGLDEADATLMAQRMETNFANEDLQAIWSPGSKGPVAEPTLPLWQNGERKHVVLRDPEFAQDALEAMKGMGKEEMGWIAELFGKPARLLQLGVTTHPTFMPRNLVRDVFDAWIKTGALPIVTQIKGARELYKKDGEFLRQYTAAGGILGGRNIAALTSKEQQANVMDMDPRKFRLGSALAGTGALGITGAIMGGPLGGIAGATIGFAGSKNGGLLKMVEAIESMTRLGVAAHAYDRAKIHNPNLTEQEAMLEAAFVARDVFDWNRRGSKTLALVRMITFLNAQIQGLDRAARAVSGSGDRGSAVAKQMAAVFRREHDIPLSLDEQRDLGEAYKTWARLGLYTALLLSLYAMYRDDDRYEDIKDGTKATHSWLPGFLGVDVRLPKAFEWAMPANFIEILWDKMEGRDPNVGERWRKSAQEVMVPPGVPQAFNLLAGWTMNTDLQSIAPWLFGEDADVVNRKIVSSELKKLPPEGQFDAFTSQLSKDIALAMAKAGLPEAMIPSPKMIDFTMRTGGYWGQDIQKGYQIIKESAGAPAGPQPRVPDLPVVGGFTGVAARQSKSTEQLYRLMSEQGGDFTTVANYYKNLMDKSGKPAEAESYLNRLEPEARAYAILNYHFTASDKRRHPLERASAMAAITRDIRKEIVLDQLAPQVKEGRKTVYDFDNKIDLPPAVKTQVTEIMERLAQAESWNGFVVLGRPGWEGKNVIATKPILAELKAAAPDVFELYEGRVEKAKIEDFETIQKDWPKMREELLRNGADASF